MHIVLHEQDVWERWLRRDLRRLPADPALRPLADVRRLP